jgi:sugar lactone lactonase YvrE
LTGSVEVLDTAACELGEGPSFDPQTGTLWWFNIVGRQMFEHVLATGHTRVHDLPVMASAIARIDAGHQLVATETGLQVRDAVTGALSLAVPIEADDLRTRSNDGRVHPSGALWIGTMGKKAEAGLGSIYWYRAGETRRLFSGITIANAICFSPDGAVAYFADTATNRILRVACDPRTGLPAGEPSLFFDNTVGPGHVDGAVTDADGNLWNARWGGAAIVCHAPDGRIVQSVELPTRQTSCPAFIPGGIAVTSAWQGMGPKKREADPQAGFTFRVSVAVRPKYEPDVLL